MLGRCVLVLVVFVPLGGCASRSDGGSSGGDASDTGGSSTDSIVVVDGDVDADADAGADDSASEAGALSDRCIAAVNAYRADVGAPPLARNVDEEACAADQARKGATDLATTGKTVFHAYFGQCAEAYQNECWYSVDDPDAVLAWCLDGFWKEGPPETGINHHSVMADPTSTRMACGFFHMVGGGYWMTQDYYH